MPLWKMKRKQQIQDRAIFGFVILPSMALGITLGCIGTYRAIKADMVDVQANEVRMAYEGDSEATEVSYDNPYSEPYIVEATAYYSTSYSYSWGVDSDGNRVKKPLVEGLTIAGRECDLGKSCVIYECNPDGTIGDCIGIYEFRDVGYGQPSGYGSSNLIKGKTAGTIETGECIDIYFETYDECVVWGRRNVYIQIIDGKG